MNLTRNIFKHSAIYSISSILGKISGFILLPFYAHIFKTEGYGIIGMLDASLGIFAILFGQGLSAAIIRIYHELDQPRKRLVISTAVWLVGALSLILFPLPIIFSPSISAFILGDSNHYILFCLAIATFIIDVAGQSSSTYLIIRQRSIFYSLMGVLRMFVQIGLNVWLVIILQIGLIGFFISSLLTVLLITSIFTFTVIKNNGLKYDKEVARRLIRFQLPLIPGEFIAFLSRQVERFFVRFLINIQSVGILEMAYKFPPLLGHFLIEPFQRAWYTKGVELAEKNNNAQNIIGTMFTNYLFLLVLLGLILAVNISSILKILTPPEFWPAAHIAKIIIFTKILVGIRTFLIFGLYFQKYTSTISKIRIITAIVKLMLSYLFILYWGILGAAYSGFFIEILLVFWIGLKAQAVYPIKIEYLNITIIIIVAISLFLFITKFNFSDMEIIPFINREYYFKLIEFLKNSFIGGINSGKIIDVLSDKYNSILCLIYNTLASLLLLILIPIKYPKYIRKIIGI